MTIKKIEVYTKSEFEEDNPTFTGNDLKVTYRTPTVSPNYGTGTTWNTPFQEPALIIWDGTEIIAAFSEYLYWKKIE